jgi:hypothetical protein
MTDGITIEELQAWLDARLYKGMLVSEAVAAFEAAGDLCQQSLEIEELPETEEDNA